MKRIWLVRLSTSGEVSHLPYWCATRREAQKYLEDYRAENICDAHMIPVRFDAPSEGAGK